MAEHTTAGKAFVARIVHQLVPTIEQDFWRDDPNKGDVIQHLCFFIEGKYGVHRIAFMTSALDACAHPRNSHEGTVWSTIFDKKSARSCAPPPLCHVPSRTRKQVCMSPTAEHIHDATAMFGACQRLVHSGRKQAGMPYLMRRWRAIPATTF